MSKANAFFLKGIVEIFGKDGEHCHRLLNVSQTRRGGRCAAGRNLSFRGGTSRFGRALACIMPKAPPSMRREKSLFNALLTHFLMGVALGLSLVLLLALIDTFHVRDLVAKSAAPVQTAVMLITTYGLMFGIGSALTGLVLTLEDES
ncbi:hypothetical protein [Bradyrhizobium sp. BWA-3-5]|uniref:hypothetical protein n=1 Tax=Bradyrhizobium sp. BWA-3-5 TaxID=3080013 RepID=UPI00293F5E0C|nr:hypothetical protein [Bradyrhizobium sp. BWA-3-5]WOH63194.1 hypothetical protein RX331_20900 [Bradyrhizobium sp. BWA-3-5]